MRRAPIIIVTLEEQRALYSGFALPDEEIVILSFGEAFCSMPRRAADLLLLDCGFEARLGLALLKDIKGRFPAIPVLFLTEESSEEIILTAFKLGVRDYLRKPVDLIALRTGIHRLLMAKRKARESREDLIVNADPVPEAGAMCGIRDLPAAIMRSVCLAETRYRDDLTLDKMARLANMSKAHFCRTFKAQVGMTPVRYLKFVRIQRAKQLLRSRNLSVATVAGQVGFRDVSNFNKNFRQFVGLSPLDYRRSLTI